MASIRFYLKPTKSGAAQIMAAFQNGDLCPTKFTGYSISAAKTGKEYKQWNKKAQRVRSCDEAFEINKKLGEWESQFNNYISECNLDKNMPDIPAFIKSLDGTYKVKPKGTPTLLSLIESFLAFVKTTYNARTYKSYKVIKEDILEYQKETKKEVLITDIDRAFYMDLSNFLIKHENNINTTINKKQGRIITIIAHEVDRLKVKLNSLDYRKKYILKEVQVPKFPLRPEELATLRAYASDEQFIQNKLDLETALSEYKALGTGAGKRKKENAKGNIKKAKTAVYHRMVLDAFLLACDTGLRHSDVIQLQPAHIQSHVTANGIIRFIDLTNIKTDGANNMPLSDRAIKILDNYIDPANRYIFRFNHSQAAGKVLKEIFKKDEVKLNRLCEVVYKKGSKTIREMKPLDQVISFHMGRNTYITWLLASKVAPSFVRDNVGHSDIKTTMSYYRDDEVLRWEQTLSVLNKSEKPA